MDLKLRARSDQFTVELVRAMPNLTIPQAASAALQLAEGVDLSRHESFASILRMVSGLQLRPESEWVAFGYAATADAIPIRLEQPRESDRTRISFEDHYLSIHTERPHKSQVHLSFHNDTVNGWRRRLGYATEPSLSYAQFAEEEDVRHVPMRRVEMLGNLWKIGAVVTWEHEWEGQTSWGYVDNHPSPGEQPSPMLNEWDAWYRIRLHPEVGRDFIAEIARNIAEIYLGYIDKVWGSEIEAGQLRGPESEAAAYIALERLWIPQRARRTHWFRQYIAGEPMPEGFRWESVLRAAAEVEDLLRGDTLPVTA